MKKNHLPLLLVLTVFFFSGQNLHAEDVDLTHLIVNHDFDYIADGIALTATTWKPKDAATNQGYTRFFGWECDLDIITGTSQGINQDFKFNGVATQNGTYGAWIGGTNVFPDLYEFYQIIDKDDLSAGTYKVQCLLAAKTNKRTSQRIFANQNVQYFSTPEWYEKNQTPGEIATFAGWVPVAAAADDLDGALKEMVVYTTIGENDSLKIGVRTGGKKKDGTTALAANPLWGWIKMDYFRLTKIDPVKAADASLTNITVSNGNLVFTPETSTYNVELPIGTSTVTIAAIPTVEDVIITGTGDIDVSSGSASSVVVATSLDGSTTTSYTINFTIETGTGLHSTSLKNSVKVNNQQLIVEGIDAFSVYNLQGMKVADIRDNASESPVALTRGVYIVKTTHAGTCKVVVN